MNENIKAVLWDFGGVFTTSPFLAFERYERENGLPKDFIRAVNSQNPENNAWAKFESNQVTREEFDRLFEDESRALGHSVRGADMLLLLSGEVRPRMVEALKKCKRHFRVGCITNNMKPADQTQQDQSAAAIKSPTQPILALFDTIVESSIEGIRKPNPKIYEIACSRLNVSPDQCVFLDDLGMNLKPARALGMTTIKVVDPDEAIAELAQATGLEFD